MSAYDNRPEEEEPVFAQSNFNDNDDNGPGDQPDKKQKKAGVGAKVGKAGQALATEVSLIDSKTQNASVKKIKRIIFIVNFIVDSLLLLAGILNLLDLESGDDFLLTIYLLVFASLLLVIELHIPAMDRFLFTHFGFFTGWMGKGLFTLFVGTLALNGPSNASDDSESGDSESGDPSTIGIVAASLTFVALLINGYIIWRNKEYRSHLNAEQQRLRVLSRRSMKEHFHRQKYLAAYKPRSVTVDQPEYSNQRPIKTQSLSNNDDDATGGTNPFGVTEAVVQQFIPEGGTNPFGATEAVVQQYIPEPQQQEYVAFQNDEFDDEQYASSPDEQQSPQPQLEEQVSSANDDGNDDNHWRNWTRFVDDESGESYWANEMTQETSWDMPPGWTDL